MQNLTLDADEEIQLEPSSFNKLVIKSDDKHLNWAEKEFIKQIGNKIYPKKGDKDGR